MEFINIDEKEYKSGGKYKNDRYMLRSYGDKIGTYLTNKESIKKNCIYEKKYCLVEVKTKYYILSWDIDFKDKLSKENSLLEKEYEEYKINHEEITQYIIKKIDEVISEMTIGVDREYVYAESTKGLGKHLYYVNIIVDKTLHIKMYESIFKKIEKEGKYNKKLMRMIIDETVCTYNGIRLFGCIKDDGYYYPVKEKSTSRIEGNIEEDFEYCLLNTSANKYNFELKIEIEDEEYNEREVKINNKKDNILSMGMQKIKELLYIIREDNKE